MKKQYKLLMSGIFSILFANVLFAQDYLMASQSPPGGLSASEVPQFVVFGWDDNGYSGLEGSAGTGAMSWILNYSDGLKNPTGSGNSATYDGTNIKQVFYNSAIYGDSWMSESNTFVKRAWNMALVDGHEIGNHTYQHGHGSAFTTQQWDAEIKACEAFLTQPFDPNEPNMSPDPTKGMGVSKSELYGFRTPYLEYSVPLFQALVNNNYVYDCSIEEGWQSENNASNYNWPYTLDNGSPGHDILVEWGMREAMSGYPGLWELPVYPFVVPPDSKLAEYGLTSSLRAKCKSIATWFDESGGKITGFDYNLLVSFKMTKAEFLATLKYSFDQHYNGNRTPFNIGCHTDYYSSKYTGAPNITAREKQEAIEELITYMLTKPETRIVGGIDVINWMRNPTALAAGNGPFSLTVNATNGSVTKNPDQAQYTKDTQVTLTAIADDGFSFVGWTGSVSSSINPLVIHMDNNKTVTATFTNASCSTYGDLHASGTYEGIADELGSTVDATPTIGGEGEAIFNWSQVKKTGDDWPWLTIGSYAPEGNLGTLCNVKITYKSDKALLLSLPQPPLDMEGISYQVSLPTATSWSTVSKDVADFAQPGWIAPAQAADLDLSVVTGIALAPDVDAVAAAYTGTLQIKELKLYGLNFSVGFAANRQSYIKEVYPNPANDAIVVTLNNAASESLLLQITNVNGQVVAEEQVNSDRHMMQVGNLANGIYLIKMTGQSDTHVQKLVIKH